MTVDELLEAARARLERVGPRQAVEEQQAGALLVEEAGGMISDTHGRPWSLASDDFLAEIAPFGPGNPAQLIETCLQQDALLGFHVPAAIG